MISGHRWLEHDHVDGDFPGGWQRHDTTDCFDAFELTEASFI